MKFLNKYFPLITFILLYVILWCCFNFASQGADISALQFRVTAQANRISVLETQIEDLKFDYTKPGQELIPGNEIHPRRMPTLQPRQLQPMIDNKTPVCY
jgi:hypothetical protein